MNDSFNKILLWIGGVLFTFLIALIGYGLAFIPGFNRLGQMSCAIILAIAYRQIFGYPRQIQAGIQFSSKVLLRLAIVLYGLKLNIGLVLSQGLGLLLQDAIIIMSVIIVMMLLAKRLKAETSLSLLLAIGTGVCGAAAIAAASPILKSKDEDTALGVGIIALVGTIFAIIYTVVRPFLPISPLHYGIWSGVSLHELAHVVLAAAPAGQDPLAIALLAKLGRVFLLIPLCFILMFWMNKNQMSVSATSKSKISFPWFLIGFIIMSIIGSYILGVYIPVSPTFNATMTQLTTFTLTMAMTGLGLNVNLHDALTKAFRPLLAMTFTSILLSIATYFFNY
ncbi:YeiH family protein [Ammoniphilus oxalaticus]|nr:putative sulfate exporter family transporter [Ammoniphilus oxalaticus]